jgi:hypothetical protein
METIQKALNIRNTDLYHDPVSTNVQFFGKTFCSDTIDKSKYHTDEQRISFIAKNVEFQIGGEPKEAFWRFNYGLDLVNGLISNSQKHLKIGIMQNIIDQYPYSTDWMVKDSMLDRLKNGIPTYVMQKPNLPHGQKKTPANIEALPAPGFQPDGSNNWGLWYWLTDATNSPQPPLGIKNPMSFRWYKSGFHWKFYMNESTVLLSTQHPLPMFYSTSASGTAGYEVTMKHPTLVAYFDNLYNFYWKYTAIKAGFDPNSPDDLPCSGTKTGKCCSMGDVQITPSCYPGGKGIPFTYSCNNHKCVYDVNGKYTDPTCKGECDPPPPPPPDPSPPGSNKKVWETIIAVSVFLLLLGIVIYFFRKYGKGNHG